MNDQKQRGIDCALRYKFDDYEIFEDGGISGELPINKRPGLSTLIENVMSGHIHGIYVTEWDRLSRGNPTQTELLKSILKENQIRMFDVNGEIHLGDVNQELLLDLKALLSSFEIKKTSLRIKRILERNAMEGKVPGGPVIRYGYKKGEGKKFIVDEDEKKIVLLVFDLAISGKGTNVIANELNKRGIPTKRSKSEKGYLTVRGKKKFTFQWRDKTIHGMLTDTAYIGKRKYKGKLYDCPAIIEEGLFYAVQEVLKTRKHRKNTTNKYFYLLKGLIECGKCRRSFYGRKREDLSDNQYICISQRHANEFCGNRGINIDFLEKYVWESLKNIDVDILKFYDWFENSDAVRLHQILLKDAQAKKEALEKRIKNLLRLGADGNIKDEFFQEEMQQLNTGLIKAECTIAAQNKALKTMEEKTDVINLIQAHTSALRSREFTPEEKVQILRAFVDRISILWNQENRTHLIYIKYKVNQLTQFKLGSNHVINYGKFGWRFSRQKVFKSSIRITKVYESGHESDTPIYNEIPMVDVF